MSKSARSVQCCRRSQRGAKVSWLFVILAITFCLFEVKEIKADKTPENESSGVTNANEKKTKTVASKVEDNENNNDSSLHSELSTLLTELREIAESIDAVRKEHGKLTKGVNEISNAVKDMNQRSEHIKKKVRKMSKVLNKNGHHHKFKNSLRNLQKDHQKILQAMINSSITHSRGKSINFSLNKRKNQIQPRSHKKSHCKNSTSNSCLPTDHASNEVAPLTAASSTTHNPKTISPAPFVAPGPTEKDNTIPEPVVEPQDGNEKFTKKAIPFPIDCTEVIQMGNTTSGVYNIHPKGMPKPIKVTNIT